MRIRKAGKIRENLWYLGREESGVYILEGKDCSVMINGGFSFILPDVLKQVSDFGIDFQKIKKFLILHSHFDHAGITPYLKRLNPEMEIYASPAAWKIFSMPKAIEIINHYSSISAKRSGLQDAIKEYDIDWRDDIKGVAIGEGYKIDLGDVALDIIDTPGHSYCSITAYEKKSEILFPSDAVGVAYQDKIFPSMNTDMTQYLESLQKLKLLPVSCICADHYGYIIGDEASNFVEKTIDAGRFWKSYMENVYRENNGDIDAATKKMATLFFNENPLYFVAYDIMEGVFRQMMKYVAKSVSLY